MIPDQSPRRPIVRTIDDIDRVRRQGVSQQSVAIGKPVIAAIPKVNHWLQAAAYFDEAPYLSVFLRGVPFAGTPGRDATGLADFTGQDPGARDCLKANRATFRSAFTPEAYAEFEQSVKSSDFEAALEHLKKAARRHGIPV